MYSTAVLAGKKRKRYIPDNKDVSVKLTGKFHHGFKEVRKSVKKAKMFETQKLVKRLKHLRKPAQNADVVAQEINDLEAQLEYLKRIDQERIAQLALSSKIRKDKSLSSNEALTSALASALSLSKAPGTQHAKVESRLLSSRFLAGEVDLVLDGLKAVLEPNLKISPAGDVMDRAKTYDGEEAEHQSSDEPSDSSKDDLLVGSTGDNKVANGLAEVIEDADDVVDDDGWESGSIHDDGEGSDDDDSGASVPPPKRLRQVDAMPPMASEAVSTFLPSLSVGFVKGDSSDFDEVEDKVADAGKKNRRGQRARQAIWEKKYGKNAKHVKRRREEAEAAATAKTFGKRLDRGWTGNRNHPRSNDGHRHTQHDKKSGALISPQSGIRGAERPTHPSWEAKKKLKENNAKILPYQGKKIVFG